MFDELDNIADYGSITIVIISILAIFVSGLFFGIFYYLMDTTQSSLEGIECDIENNFYVENCQELFDLSIYPFLELREIFIWFSFFFIFALTLGMLIIGYRSGKSPVLLGLLVTFVIVLTYIGIEVSNIYRSMLDIEIFRTMMLEFTVYNKIMLNFPWFVFFVGLMSVLLSIVNYQRTKVNTYSAGEMDY